MDEQEQGGSGRRDRPAKPVRDSRLRKPTRVYEVGSVLGNGSFGVVCEARCRDTGETVAVKKVLQDPRYKNRELDIMKELKHPNVVTLRDWFYTEDVRDSDGVAEVYLNVVMDHIPETAHKVMKSYVRNNQSMPSLLVKLYTYQMCRALGYLHSLGICHRDIKPQNLLVDSRTHVLKLCDFGSAKRFSPHEPSVAYICSRFYRAPELMLGATHYSSAIDVWSIGCVMGELILGKPLFAGETSVDQLVKIIQVLGTPTPAQMQAMNPNYTDFRFPDVRMRDWRRVLGQGVQEEGLELIKQFLKYEPAERIRPLDALAHPYFDELRHPDTRIPSGGQLPELFNFTSDELAKMSPQTRASLMPAWGVAQQQPAASGHQNSTPGGGDHQPAGAAATQAATSNSQRQ